MSTKLEEKTTTSPARNVNRTTQRELARPDLVKEVTLRVSLPIAVPAIALLAVAVVVFLFGLFLLNLPHEQAPAVSLALSLNILAAATYAASKPKLARRTIAELAILVVYPVLLAVVLVNLGVGHSEATATETAAGAPAAAEEVAPVEIGASNLEFSTDELAVPAGEEFVMAFDNSDAAPHNVSIYANDTLDEEFFTGSNVEPGASIEYEIPALETGAYYFQCDLHPTMNGRVIAE